jgi:hypothetical protein
VEPSTSVSDERDQRLDIEVQFESKINVWSAVNPTAASRRTFGSKMKAKLRERVMQLLDVIVKRQSPLPLTALVTRVLLP